MNYQDSKAVQYGDMIYISTTDNRYMTVEEDGIAITFKQYENDGHKQKILVCGNDTLGNKFYLTFKYSNGFIHYDNHPIKSGVPWTERTLFSSESLKRAIGMDDIVFTPC